MSKAVPHGNNVYAKPNKRNQGKCQNVKKQQYSSQGCLVMLVEMERPWYFETVNPMS